MHIIVLFGLPGSGKGTQAKMFQNKIEICSVGEILRGKAKSDSDQSRAIAKALSTGLLLSGDIATEIVIEHLDNCQQSLNPISNSVILDGYPRSIDQLASLKLWCDKVSSQIHFIYLDISLEESMKRLLNRVLCAQCEYPMIKGENLQCKCCKSKDFYIRNDDNVSSIQNRLAIYLSSVQDMLDQFKESGIVHRVDGTRSPELVYEEICCIMSNIGAAQ